MKKIVILTGSELRHRYFRQFLSCSKYIKVLKSYCEGEEKSLKNLILKSSQEKDLRIQHLNQRECYEREFFLEFCQKNIDNSNPVYIDKGAINHQKYVDEIQYLDPDLIISYGCSIINSKLLEHFKDRFINVHLGLSPYYRGSGTNYFPFVNNEPVFCGVTFMHIDRGIDTGEIIHQIRAELRYGDNIHLVGNRLIESMTSETEKLIFNFDTLKNKSVNFPPLPRYFYKNKDFTEKSLEILYDNFSSGMIENYILNKDDLCEKYPIVQQHWEYV